MNVYSKNKGACWTLFAIKLDDWSNASQILYRNLYVWCVRRQKKALVLLEKKGSKGIK